MSDESVLPTPQAPAVAGQVRASVTVDEDRDMSSVLELDTDTTDPDFAYKFVKDEPARIARHRLKGYVLVSSAEGVRPVVDVDNQADGTIRVGDTILMKCKRERVERRVKMNSEKARVRLHGPVRKVQQKADRAGFKITEKELGEERS